MIMVGLIGLIKGTAECSLWSWIHSVMIRVTLDALILEISQLSVIFADIRSQLPVKNASFICLLFEHLSGSSLLPRVQISLVITSFFVQ